MMATSDAHIVRWAALVLLLWAACAVSTAKSVRRVAPLTGISTGAPNCSIPQSNILECVYLTAADMGLLTQWLQTTQASYSTFVVLLRACDASAITSDIFTGYGISELTVEMSGVTAMPWDTYLTSLGSALTSLRFLDNTITTVSKPTTTPTFIDSLLSFELPGNGIQSLEDGAFDDYSVLSTIDLDDNQLTSIGQHFRGLYALQALDLSSNLISTIADNAFEDLFFIESLELQANKLQTLQQAAFTGLDFVPSINLIGNPFNCTCDLEWLKDWLDEKGILTKSGANCAAPVNAPFANVDFCPTRRR